MISSAEFDRLLQAGHIAQALALLLRATNEIDVTTDMTDEIRANSNCGRSSDLDIMPRSEYLRTKINLLTGEIHNEVGKDLIANSSSYLKLQQFHIEQIIASHRIVQEHLHQIQIMLTAMPSAQDSAPADEPNYSRVDLADSLPSRLTEAFRAILTSPSGDLSRNHLEQLDATLNILTEPSEDLTLSPLPQSSSPLSRSNTLPPPQSILSPTAFDDIDLSIDEHMVEWEEWIEDERIESASPPIQTATASQEANISTWGADWERQSPSPPHTTVKPLKSRVMATSEAIDPSAQWDKFMPEHLGIYVDPKPNSSNNHHDPHQVDRLLADLDKISQAQGNKG
jgi:hypothetical protein